VHAYLYLRVEPGKLDDVVIQLHGVHGVRAAAAVVGDWDAMAAVEGADFRAIARAVIKEVHAIEGVTRAYTAPVVPPDLLGVAAERIALPMHRGAREACYVHVSAQAGRVGEVFEAVAGSAEVSAVAVLAGQYDLLAELPTVWEHASRIILERIHPIPGVLATNTLVGMPGIEDEPDG
jgi:DNA-binding Lrp family transcriptional regulator